METMTARDASRSFSALLDRVYFNGAEVVIERDGIPVAMVCPAPARNSVAEFNEWLTERGPSVAADDDDMQSVIGETRELLTVSASPWLS